MFLGSDSLELGSASVGVGEDSQLDSQLINSPTLSDSSDNEPIDNPWPVRRPFPAFAKRPPFPSTTSRPATTGVVSRPSTSANTNQRFSSGVSTPPSSANNRQQCVIPAVIEDLLHLLSHSQNVSCSYLWLSGTVFPLLFSLLYTVHSVS
jgi:hypothetical protein